MTRVSFEWIHIFFNNIFPHLFYETTGERVMNYLPAQILQPFLIVQDCFV